MKWNFSFTLTLKSGEEKKTRFECYGDSISAAAVNAERLAERLREQYGAQAVVVTGLRMEETK